MAKEIAQGRVVTVRVDGMTFYARSPLATWCVATPAGVKRGNTSVTINIEVWVKKSFFQNRLASAYKATEALFIYVAVDNQGKPRPLPAE